LTRRGTRLTSQWNPDEVLFEEAASSQSLIREPKRRPVVGAADGPLHASIPIVTVPVERDKVTRAHSVTPPARAGGICPEGVPWLQPFLDELRVFYTEAAHDDQLDAFMMALRYMRQGQSVLDFHCKQMEEAKATRDREREGLPPSPKPSNPMIECYRETLARLKAAARGYESERDHDRRDQRTNGRRSPPGF